MRVIVMGRPNGPRVLARTRSENPAATVRGASVKIETTTPVGRTVQRGMVMVYAAGATNGGTLRVCSVARPEGSTRVRLTLSLIHI